MLPKTSLDKQEQPQMRKKGGGFSCFSCLGKKRPLSSAENEDTQNGNNDDITISPDEILSQKSKVCTPVDNGDTNIRDIEEEDDKARSPSKLHDSVTMSCANTGTSPSSSITSPSQQMHTTSSASSPAPPQKAGFLVSFMVDARGGAMTGGRGCGLRLIIPPTAIEQPMRVTCRYLKCGPNDRQLLFPPPLMEREALASRVIEMGPAGTWFHAPVLIEVPHFASLKRGERELVVLRSDDGETWQEHTMAYYSGWSNGKDQEGTIYQDFVASAGISAAYEVLATDRVVRISTKVFPHYFAIISRIKEDIKVIGADGGKIVASNMPQLQLLFPKGALHKRIRVGLQTQSVPAINASIATSQGSLTMRNVKMSPLIVIEPRRRRFHAPVQVMIPLPKKNNLQTNRRIRLLCSLTGNSSNANWEDVTNEAPFLVCSEDRMVIFETKVSALFWAVASDDSKDSDKIANCKDTDKQSYEDAFDTVKHDEELLNFASKLYRELLLPVYMVKIVVFYKPHTPRAWCDCLQIYCVTDDKADLCYDQEVNAAYSSLTLRSNKSSTMGREDWTVLAVSDEMEVAATSQLNIELLKGNVETATDCQLEFAYRPMLTFKPFQRNSAILLVKSVDKSQPRTGELIITKSITEGTQMMEDTLRSPLCTLNIDLDGGNNAVHKNAVSMEKSLIAQRGSHSQISNKPDTIVSLSSHVVQWMSEDQGTSTNMQASQNAMDEVETAHQEASSTLSSGTISSLSSELETCNDVPVGVDSVTNNTVSQVENHFIKVERFSSESAEVVERKVKVDVMQKPRDITSLVSHTV